MNIKAIALAGSLFFAPSAFGAVAKLKGDLQILSGSMNQLRGNLGRLSNSLETLSHKLSNRTASTYDKSNRLYITAGEGMEISLQGHNSLNKDLKQLTADDFKHGVKIKFVDSLMFGASINRKQLHDFIQQNTHNIKKSIYSLEIEQGLAIDLNIAGLMNLESLKNYSNRYLTGTGEMKNLKKLASPFPSQLTLENIKEENQLTELTLVILPTEKELSIESKSLTDLTIFPPDNGSQLTTVTLKNMGNIEKITMYKHLSPFTHNKTVTLRSDTSLLKLTNIEDCCILEKADVDFLQKQCQNIKKLKINHIAFETFDLSALKNLTSLALGNDPTDHFDHVKHIKIIHQKNGANILNIDLNATLPNLESINLDNCFVDFTKLPPSVKNITIKDSPNLTITNFNHLPNLETLEIENIKKITSIDFSENKKLTSLVLKDVTDNGQILNAIKLKKLSQSILNKLEIKTTWVKKETGDLAPKTLTIDQEKVFPKNEFLTLLKECWLQTYPYQAPAS